MGRQNEEYGCSVIRATGIADAFRKTLRFIDRWAYQPPNCWFRGINDATLSLQPGACWRKGYDEQDALARFIQKGVAFQPVGNLMDWNTYYLAQHYRVPTRLIDWTESFAAALFFALDGWNGRTTPAVWILQSALLNESFMGWYGLVGPEDMEEIRIWLPPEIRKPKAQTVSDGEGYLYDNDWPIAITPRWANARLVAQQGMFTVHGRQPEDLRELIEQKGKKAGDHIARVELHGLRRKQAVEELGMLGIRRSAIYPDLANFVTELRETGDW